MKNLKKGFVLSICLLMVIFIQTGLGLESDTKTNVRKKAVSKDSLVTVALEKLYISGIIAQILRLQGEKTVVFGGIVIISQGVTSNLDNLRISVNSMKLNRRAPNSSSFNLPMTKTSGLINYLNVIIRNKTSSNPPIYETWVTANGGMNPVRMTFPPVRYVHTLKTAFIPARSPKSGFSVTWTNTRNRIDVSLDKYVSESNVPTIKRWDYVTGNSKFISDSLLKSKEKYRIRILQYGKPLKLKGNFTPTSAFHQRMEIHVIFSTN